jgi:hypothetical protein
LVIVIFLIDTRRPKIIKMALSPLGVNKLRSSLTMFGITIGVFRHFSHDRNRGAAAFDRERTAGSNIFQFANTGER